MIRPRTIASILTYTAGSVIGSALQLAIVPQKPPGVRSPLLPPGPVIGVVWTVLFAMLGAARAKLHGHPREQRLVDALWLGCLSYPLYTDGMRNRPAAYAGNIATILTTAAIVARIRRVSPAAARLVLPVIPWVIFATIGIAAEPGRSTSTELVTTSDDVHNGAYHA